MARRGGLHRLGRRRFRYVDSRGRAVEDEERLERIRALAIPPAWQEYIADRLGNGFTAKDFRTWGGTLVAASELARVGAPEDDREATRVLAHVMRTVGRELGNTPAVARASYVSPAVVEAYRAGLTLDDFRAGHAGPARLSTDERALLRLLRASARGR